jgi:hypothetical protein
LLSRSNAWIRLLCVSSNVLLSANELETVTYAIFIVMMFLFAKLPLDCCPHWNVCCPGGRYGCCDPGSLRVMESNFAFALFTQAKVENPNPLSVLKIDLNTGDKTEIATAYNDGGETSRSWAWSPQLNAFLLPQTNYLDISRNVTLNVINAKNGKLQVSIFFQLLESFYISHFTESSTRLYHWLVFMGK